MKRLSNFIPSAKVCSFIILALCLWQIYVFYHIGFSRGESHAIEHMMVEKSKSAKNTQNYFIPTILAKNTCSGKDK